MYREAPPPERLRQAVRCLWWAELSGAKRIVPDGCLDLMVGGGQVFVAGPDTRAWDTTAPRGARLHGIRFRPGHAPRVLGVAADELRDQRVDLADLWGRPGARAAERLLERPSLLAEVVAGNLREPDDPEVGVLLARLDAGAPRVAAALSGIAVSERQLRRRFTLAVGYGPATYLRVTRLQRALAAVRHTADLAALAAESGYADQAHLSRDCRELTGQTARAFFARP
ncbi:helix-turn-helix transcriptional regulator [Amycolatopsis anabasis]|uniref:helix-turn-helix transcriptional regulator n=1 Tax=Amycolatopsis anabasis TaxID=1840409 RepID=UPI001FE85F0D|nr:helix-turn-helix transcriptional regulator [Amycolatopsis anabasis]